MDRKLLNINGIPTTVMCDATEKLADVIRHQAGLTGTKVACRQGQCGCCSVILNGKVVRSCTTTMKRVPAESEITTIEGIGTPDKLHALQLAWILHGGAQCGYCSPGFIVSSKALLDQNPDPTREEIRDWWQKHANVCRCTGYKPLVDAVIDAAKVLRGEMSEDELDVQGAGRRPHLEHALPAAVGRRQGHRHDRLRRRPRAQDAARHAVLRRGPRPGVARQRALHRRLRGREDARRRQGRHAQGRQGQQPHQRPRHVPRRRQGRRLGAADPLRHEGVPVRRRPGHRLRRHDRSRPWRPSPRSRSSSKSCRPT